MNSPFRINTVIVDPVGNGRNTDATLEGVALVRVLGEDKRGHESSIRPAPDGDPGGGYGMVFLWIYQNRLVILTLTCQ